MHARRAQDAAQLALAVSQALERLIAGARNHGQQDHAAEHAQQIVRAQIIAGDHQHHHVEQRR